MDNRELVFDDWLGFIENGKFAQLKEEINQYNEADIAAFFQEIPIEKKLFVFRLLTKDNAADVFSFMDSDTQELIVKSITDNEVRHIVYELSLDDAVDFLSEIPANLVTRVLQNTDEEKRKLINEFLNYPDDSAGSIMTIEFVQFNKELTVQNAMEQLRKTGTGKETIYSCYVVDERRVLMGMVSLRTLIFADDNAKVKDIMDEDAMFVKTLDDQEDIAYLFKKYGLIALPVVDNEQRLVGIITVDDIVDVIEQENTEDIEKMSALIPAEDEYLKTSVVTLAKNRVVWLLVLMISGTLSSVIITEFQGVLASSVILASLFPILMGTGGNAGSQSSTLIIRGMAVGEIETSDIFRVIWKELRVGVITGFALGCVNFIRLFILGNVPVNINLTVSFSMMCTVILAKSIGSTLPILAKKLKFDPAIMAGPLITTVVDCLALLIFFTAVQAFVL
ncbi:MAG TPA: magnesium transporter [Lachnospiraceae bacterium]|nr:magnesium transporter [Lachnospiraceae bacterium]